MYIINRMFFVTCSLAVLVRIDATGLAADLGFKTKAASSSVGGLIILGRIRETRKGDPS